MFLRIALGVEIPLSSLVVGNVSPFSYLVHTFFEGRYRWRGEASSAAAGLALLKPLAMPMPADCVVWASRGGGKTYLGAVATLLDLVFKPGIEVRILGGSLEQSQRMHEHLRKFFERPLFAHLIDGRITERRVQLASGSSAQVLAQSQTSVRGTRVQKVRCDEVELFEPEVWDAAQLTTRSIRLDGPWGRAVRGSVEALSTMHKPFGLMWDIVSGTPTGTLALAGENGSASSSEAEAGAARAGDSPTLHSSCVAAGSASGESGPVKAEQIRNPDRPRRAGKRCLFRWGVVDVLGYCSTKHVCSACSLEPECAGRAKLRGGAISSPAAAGALALQPAITNGARAASPTGPPMRVTIAGHISIDDAVRLKSRVGEHVWQAEMLCLRPRRTDCVYPEFDHRVHVGDWPIESSMSGADGAGNPVTGRVRWIAGMDFGFRSPTVVLLARLGDDGRTLYIEAEHSETEWTIDEHIARIRGGMGLGFPVPEWIGVDPAGHQRSDQTGISSIAALRKAGLTVLTRAFEIQEGVSLIRSRLRPAAKSGSGATSVGPELFVHRRCAKLTEALQRYHYPEDRPESLAPVKDGYDHPADALRYLVVNLDRPHQVKKISYT